MNSSRCLVSPCLCLGPEQRRGGVRTFTINSNITNLSGLYTLIWKEINHFVYNPFRGEFFWFYEVQRVDIFFENGRKLTSLVIGLYWTQHLN